MAGNLKVQQVQLGDSATATNNFVLSVPATPDGSVKLSRGVLGATTSDVLSIGADGRVTGKGLPFAGATFSITGGVLTVHSSFGMTMSRVSTGIYHVTFTVSVPANHAASINQVRSTSWGNGGCEYVKAWSTLEFVENGMYTDVYGYSPSSVLFFEV